MVEVDDKLLSERRRRGDDRFDEMWEGVLHMNPPPSSRHQELAGDLYATLRPLAKSRGLDAWYETGLYRPGTDEDWRVPDLMIASPEVRTERGVDGSAALVIEIRSPSDESYEKLPFYASLGVGEVLLVDPDDRRLELYRFPHGDPVLVQDDPDRGIQLAAVGAWLLTVDTPEGPRLRITGDAGDALL